LRAVKDRIGCRSFKKVSIKSQSFSGPAGTVHWKRRGAVTLLIQLIYTSKVSSDFREHEIPELLKKSRPANAKLQITGMFFYLGTAFLQVLEGEAPSVDSVYSRVLVDTRHTRVVTISREPIGERSFPNWTMDFATVDPVEADEIIGDPGSFTSGARVRLDSRGANRLITAFRRPKWPKSGGSSTAPIVRRGQ
jgi:Sensors of blue-light using FAD